VADVEEHAAIERLEEFSTRLVAVAEDAIGHAAVAVAEDVAGPRHVEDLLHD